MRNKTDRTDARGIAQILRSGWFSPVHMKSREAHATRALPTCRKAIQRKCIDLANEIRGLFRVFGLRLPPRIDQGSFDERVRTIIEADPDLSRALLPLLDARAVHYKTYRELDRRVKQAGLDARLSLSHFADVFHMRSAAIYGLNPFIAEDFRRIDARQVLDHDSMHSADDPRGP